MRKKAAKSESSKRQSTPRNKTGKTRARTSAGSGDETDLQKLFLDELADIYNAEQQLTKALPKMAKAAESDELRQAFEDHLQETTNQISRLDEVFRGLGESVKRKTCKGMQGLVEEGKEIMEEHEGSEALDAALIASAQKVEHYEIASYGTLCAWAELMGHSEALELLKENMGEEEAADEKLTQLAESSANQRAEQS
jgi:ferritin-like metal-binding protein YciE